MVQKLKNRVLLSPPHMSGDEMKYIQKAFDENYVVPLGPNVNDFEKNMVSYLGEKDIYAVAMNSGTAAIHIALRLLDLQPGEEVFCSSATFIASANPIMYEKAVPVFIDSETETWNLCPKSLLKAIEQKRKSGKIPRVLICAELFGMSANYHEIEKICSEYGIQIIEDSAESLGSKYKNKKCGTFGKFGILSFNGNKIITTSGGGMLITHSKTEAEKAVFLITQARDDAPYYLHSHVGYNYRMSNICAGIGIGQLQHIDERVASRRRNFKFYRESLTNTPLTFRKDTADYYSNEWLTTATISANSTKDVKGLIKHLAEYNIEARHIWKPLHTQPLFKNNEFFQVEKKAVAEHFFDSGLCLPSGSSLDEQTLSDICEVIRAYFN